MANFDMAFYSLMIIFGILALIAVTFYIVSYFKRDKNENKKEGEEELFNYLAKECENAIESGKLKEASTIFNRLNHVYQYLDKEKKKVEKGRLDSLFSTIKDLEK